MALDTHPQGGPIKNFFQNNYLIFIFATAFLLLIVQPNVWYTVLVYHTLWYDLTYAGLPCTSYQPLGRLSSGIRGTSPEQTTAYTCVPRRTIQ